MDLDYARNTPEVKGLGGGPNKGNDMEGFEPINRKLPLMVEKWAEAPYDIPRPSKAEIWVIKGDFMQVLRSRRHEKIQALIAIPKETKSDQYTKRMAKINPLFMRIVAEGDIGDYSTFSEYFIRGSLRNRAVCIRMPRRGEQTPKNYFELFLRQYDNCIEAISLAKLFEMYHLALSIPDQFIASLKKSSEGGLSMSVVEFQKTFQIPFVNGLRHTGGFAQICAKSEEVEDMYYDDRKRGSKNTGWVYLVSPKSDTYLKLQRPENVLYLYAGPGAGRLHPQESIYNYSKTKMLGDSATLVPNLARPNSFIGVNILQSNYELSHWYRFKNMGMLDKSIKGNTLNPRNMKDIIRNDIKIMSHKDRDMKKVSYKDAASALIDQYKPEFWNNLARKSDGNYSFWTFVDRMCEENEDGDFKNSDDYIKYLLRAYGLNSDYHPSELFSRESSMKSSAEFSQKRSHITTRIQDLGKFLNIEPNDEKFLYGYAYGKHLSSAGVGPDTVLKEDDKPSNAEKFAKLLIALKEEDAIKLIKLGLSGFASEEEESVESRMILSSIGFLGNIEKDDIKIANGIQGKLKQLLNDGIDLPFCVALFQRTIFLVDGILKIKAKSMVEYFRPLTVDAAQKYAEGFVEFNFQQKMGASMKEKRNCHFIRAAYLDDVVAGGNTAIYKKKNPESEREVKKMLKQSLYPVIMDLKYALTDSRPDAIDRTGFDSPTLWRGAIQRTMLRRKDGKDEDDKPYYKHYKETCSRFGFKPMTKTNKSHPHLKKKYSYHKHTMHWGGATVFLGDRDKSYDRDVGLKFPCWWRGESPEDYRNMRTPAPPAFGSRGT
jgi:hypothetical protein